MPYAHKDLETNKDVMNWMAMHQSAAQVARDAYTKKYGIDYHDDKEYKTGNERHAFWLKAWETRYESLILDPYQE